MAKTQTSLWEEDGEAMPPLDITITATHINYYHVCKRKLWLFAQGVSMERDSSLVQIGKQIGESSYPRRAERWRELDIGVGKIDHYDPRERIVREVKKSNKLEPAHIAQVQFYLVMLERMGIEGVRGRLEYPALRLTREVVLTPDDRQKVQHWCRAIENLLRRPCPTVVRKGICQQCAYRDFCFC